MFQFALFLALFVFASVFAVEPEAKKDLKGAEQVYIASPYATWGYAGYPYAGLAGYPYNYLIRWVPHFAVAPRRTDDDTARPID